MKEIEKQNEELALDICRTFIKKYFKEIDLMSKHDVYFIGNEISCFNVVGIGDYFFDVSNMYDYLKYKYSKKKMFEHYWYQLDCYEKEIYPINIKNYLKLKK